MDGMFICPPPNSYVGTPIRTMIISKVIKVRRGHEDGIRVFIRKGRD